MQNTILKDIHTYIYIQREIDVLLCDQAMFESKSLGVVDFTGLGGI